MVWVVFLPIKDREIFVLSFKAILRRFSAIVSMWREQPIILKFGKLSNQILLARLKDDDVVKKFKDHSEKTVEALKIDCPILSDLSDDAVLSAIEFFPTMLFLKIKETRDFSDCFSFN